MSRQGHNQKIEISEMEQKEWDELIRNATTPKFYPAPAASEDLASEIRKAIKAQRSRSHDARSNAVRDSFSESNYYSYTQSQHSSIDLNTSSRGLVATEGSGHSIPQNANSGSYIPGRYAGIHYSMLPQHFPNQYSTNQQSYIVAAFEQEARASSNSVVAPAPRVMTPTPAGATISMPFGDPSLLRLEQFGSMKDLIAAKRDMRLANERFMSRSDAKEKTPPYRGRRSRKQSGYISTDPDYRIKKASKPASPRRPIR